jgi:hypothetical protein
MDSGQSIWSDSKWMIVKKAKSSGVEGGGRTKKKSWTPPYRPLERLSSLQREATTIFGANLVVNLLEE